jgi:hypothetical protein
MTSEVVFAALGIPPIEEIITARHRDAAGRLSRGVKAREGGPVYPIGEWWKAAPTLCGDSVGIIRTRAEENQREVQCVTSGA